MSGTHKYPTISFRISPREREEIEAKDFCKRHEKERLFCPFLHLQSCMRGREERNGISDCGKVTGNAEPHGRTGRTDKK